MKTVWVRWHVCSVEIHVSDCMFAMLVYVDQMQRHDSSSMGGVEPNHGSSPGKQWYLIRAIYYHQLFIGI